MNMVNSIDPTKATYEPIVISLPIADRLRSYNFYRRALGLLAIGAPADEGVPEPLQFVVNAGVRVMLSVTTSGDGCAVCSSASHRRRLAESPTARTAVYLGFFVYQGDQRRRKLSDDQVNGVIARLRPAAAAFARVSGVRMRALRERLRPHSRVRIEPLDMRRVCEPPDRSTLLGLRGTGVSPASSRCGYRQHQSPRTHQTARPACSGSMV